jgi:hypothetical protein
VDRVLGVAVPQRVGDRIDILCACVCHVRVVSCVVR